MLGVCEATADLNESRLELLDADAVLEPRQAGVLVLVSQVPGSEPKLKPTVGEQVRDGDGSREQRWVPEPPFST